MIFNQLEFLFLFLPAVVALFVAFPGYRHVILIAASLLFYGLSGIDHTAILVLGSLWTWWLCRSDAIAGSTTRLVAATLPPILALVYYKYLRFILETAGISADASSAAFRLLDNLVLPAGISFFTFHLLAYAIDRYRGELEASAGLKDFLLFMSFFPHLVAGPILRYRDVSGALATLASYRIGADAAARAAGHVAVGLAVKVLIADTLGNYVTQLTSSLGSLGAAAGLFIVYGYSFQIYFDFYGYSLVAIGLGGLFGFAFPRNFDSPYTSPDIREFWRRWHMTLSFWIRDYLYKPLGGNAKYARNILVVFIVCGLWHGAGWNFVAWGLAHGIFVALYHRYRTSWDRMPLGLRTAATFTIVSLLWILFLFDFQRAAAFITAVTSNGLRLSQVAPEMWAFLGLAAFVCFRVDLECYTENAKQGSPLLRNVALGGVFLLAVLFLNRSQTFIYFRF